MGLIHGSKTELLERNESGIGFVSSRPVQPNQRSEIFHSTMVLGLQKQWLMDSDKNKENHCKQNDLFARHGSGLGCVSFRSVQLNQKSNFHCWNGSGALETVAGGLMTIQWQFW